MNKETMNIKNTRKLIKAKVTKGLDIAKKKQLM